jgi:hypothetical protein
VILGKATWHMRSGYNDADWLDWCQSHMPWLSAEFLRRVDGGEPVRPFFGSWFELRGRKQCGYFLGTQLIKELEERMDLREIALLDDWGTQFRNLLERRTPLGAR